MYQPVAHDHTPEPDPILEYTQALESTDPWALNRIMQKYDGQDDIMVAFLALHKAFDSSLPFTEQLYLYRATGETVPARTPLIIPDAQGISKAGHVTYRVWRFISRAWGK